MKRLLCLLLLLTLLPAAHADREPAWCVGHAAQEMTYGDLADYYIAGYTNGAHPEGVLDAQTVQAVWLQAGADATLLIAVDCVALDGGTVAVIRERLTDFCRETGCMQVNVVSTHTHAGVDTLGLWGPVGIDGKNAAWMAQLTDATVAAAHAAWENRAKGTLHYSATPTEGLQHDSRAPKAYDENLYQLRFVPEDGGAGVRIISYAAHAESLRGKNRLISRDYPGAVADIVREKTGDAVVYLPGAIGGLIMTKEFTLQGAAENLRITGERLAEVVLHPAGERALSPALSLVRQEFATPLENTLFIWYKFLGILGSDVSRGWGGYTLHTELSLLTLGSVTLALLPGEIFPELVAGTGNPEDPEGLRAIAAANGVVDLVVIGLANDEIGYIVPPSAFLLDGEAPYVRAAKGHYEETNAVGPRCAIDLAEAFRQALAPLGDN